MNNLRLRVTNHRALPLPDDEWTKGGLGEAVWRVTEDDSLLQADARSLRAWRPGEGAQTLLELDPGAIRWIPGQPRVGWGDLWLEVTPTGGHLAALKCWWKGDWRGEVFCSRPLPRSFRIVNSEACVWAAGGGHLWEGEFGKILNPVATLPDGVPVSLWMRGETPCMLLSSGDGMGQIWSWGGEGWVREDLLLPAPSNMVLSPLGALGWSSLDHCLHVWDKQWREQERLYLPSEGLSGLVRVDASDKNIWAFHYPWHLPGTTCTGPLGEIRIWEIGGTDV